MKDIYAINRMSISMGGVPFFEHCELGQLCNPARVRRNEVATQFFGLVL